MKKKFKILRDSLLILLITLVLLEVVLQIASLFMDASRSEGIDLVFGDISVVALGDSNTYGLNVSIQEAYPRQLEKYWNKRHKQKMQILNLGYPGTNSSQLRRNLPAVLDRFHPHIILMTIGVNDFWTDPFIDTLEGRTLIWNFFRKLRLYKLYYMLSRIKFNQSLVNDDQGFRLFNGNDKKQVNALFKKMAKEGGIEGGLNYPGFKFKTNLGIRRSNPGQEAIINSLAENIKYMNTLIQDSGADLWLTTYVSPKTYGPASAAIRRIATDQGLRLIDIGKKIEKRCHSEKNCADYLFPDEHPTAKGYRIVAEIIADELNIYLK